MAASKAAYRAAWSSEWFGHCASAALAGMPPAWQFCPRAPRAAFSPLARTTTSTAIDPEHYASSTSLPATPSSRFASFSPFQQRTDGTPETPNSTAADRRARAAASARPRSRL